MCYISLSLDDHIKTLIVGISRMGYCSPEALNMVKCAMSALRQRATTVFPLSRMPSGYLGTSVHDLRHTAVNPVAGSGADVKVMQPQFVYASAAHHLGRLCVHI